MKVKICGITRLSDALYAEKLGAAVIGLIFAESKRRVSLKDAAAIAKRLKRAKKAGVFVNEKPAAVNAAIKAARLDFVQLHGDESPAYIRKIRGAAVIKAVRVKNAAQVRKQAEKYAGSADFLLFDTYSAKARGGTGKTFDLGAVKKAGKIRLKYFVAGGVNPGNAGEITRKARPYGLDVSSGVEAGKPGIKDRAKLRRLFAEIRKCAKVER